MPADGTDDKDDLKSGSDGILLLVVSSPEGNHVIPQGSGPLEDPEPGMDEYKASIYAIRLKGLVLIVFSVSRYNIIVSLTY